MVVLGFICSVFELAPPGWIIFVGGCLMLVIGCWHGFRGERRRVLELRSAAEGRSLAIRPDLQLALKFGQDLGFGMSGAEIGKTWAITHRFEVSITNLGSAVSVAEIQVTYRVDDKRVTLPADAEAPRPRLPQTLKAPDTMIQYYSLQPGHFVEFLARQPQLLVVTSCGHRFVLDEDSFDQMKDTDGRSWKDVIVNDSRG